LERLSVDYGKKIQARILRVARSPNLHCCDGAVQLCPHHSFAARAHRCGHQL
jgi:hypothetical protein